MGFFVITVLQHFISTCTFINYTVVNPVITYVIILVISTYYTVTLDCKTFRKLEYMYRLA